MGGSRSRQISFCWGTVDCRQQEWQSCGLLAAVEKLHHGTTEIGVTKKLCGGAGDGGIRSARERKSMVQGDRQSTQTGVYSKSIGARTTTFRC